MAVNNSISKIAHRACMSGGLNKLFSPPGPDMHARYFAYTIIDSHQNEDSCKTVLLRVICLTLLVICLHVDCF